MQSAEEFAGKYVALFCPASEPCQPCLDDSEDLAELVRERDAEVRADERAKVLAEFTEETRTREDGYAGMSSSHDTPGLTYTATTFWSKPPTRERRLVSPWKKE